jgi:hypothetical protein
METTDKFLRFCNKRKVKNETNHRAVEASCAGCGAPEIEHKIESERERKRVKETQNVLGGGGSLPPEARTTREALYNLSKKFNIFLSTSNFFLSSQYL